MLGENPLKSHIHFYFEGKYILNMGCIQLTCAAALCGFSVLDSTREADVARAIVAEFPPQTVLRWNPVSESNQHHQFKFNLMFAMFSLYNL